VSGVRNDMLPAPSSPMSPTMSRSIHQTYNALASIEIFDAGADHAIHRFRILAALSIQRFFRFPLTHAVRATKSGPTGAALLFAIDRLGKNAPAFVDPGTWREKAACVSWWNRCQSGQRESLLRDVSSMLPLSYGLPRIGQLHNFRSSLGEFQRTRTTRSRMESPTARERIGLGGGL